jgi:hypothetical protein
MHSFDIVLQKLVSFKTSNLNQVQIGFSHNNNNGRKPKIASSICVQSRHIAL